MGEEWSALGMQKGGLCNTSRDFSVFKSNKSLTTQEETEAQQECEIPEVTHQVRAEPVLEL